MPGISNNANSNAMRKKENLFQISGSLPKDLFFHNTRRLFGVVCKLIMRMRQYYGESIEFAL